MEIVGRKGQKFWLITLSHKVNLDCRINAK